jgi:hypothetical protein
MDVNVGSNPSGYSMSISTDAQQLFEKYTFLQLKTFSWENKDLSEYEQKVLNLALALHSKNMRRLLNETKK